MVLVGVTGGVGTGKSTALAQFGRRGVHTLDADRIAHAQYEPGTEAHACIRRRWGPAVLAADGTIDRAAVASIVFDDPDERTWLNELLHPLVRTEIRQQAAAAPDPVFCAVPLLYEVGWEADMNCVVVVWCDAQTQLERLRRRQWSADQIRRRMDAQLDTTEKLAQADYGLINTGSLELLGRQCDKVLQQVRTRYALS